eukprot:sb/3468901/
MTVLKEGAEESFTATCDYIINNRQFPKTIEAVVTRVDYPSPEFVWDIADDQGTQDSVKCSFSKITAHDGADSDDLGDAILGMEIDGSHSDLEISTEKDGEKVVVTLDKAPSDMELGRRDMRCYIHHDTAINKGDKILGDVIPLFVYEISTEKDGEKVVVTLDKAPSDMELGRRDMRCYIHHDTAINKGDKILGDVIPLFVYDTETNVDTVVFTVTIEFTKAGVRRDISVSTVTSEQGNIHQGSI